ncbi:hypothetical protein P799_08150 [Lysinibacillus sphaericus CBAM5]|uniref:Uncharacterized protein n=2 Tax=Lysinibacillus sphaericus TaxID=1421 RepID=B1HXX0_LYSSC|nr:hypothetical protein Bsph_2544 [Lysinibacillus sphaericus C3-41]EWH34215.1 hypothetical protein P799_08150 [Lysinibacillus sphaericus CBAM5]
MPSLRAIATTRLTIASATYLEEITLIGTKKISLFFIF